MKLTHKNYFEDNHFVSYHQLKDFAKCEYLYLVKSKGLVDKIERPYFFYGNVFESVLAEGSLPKDVQVGWGRSKKDKEAKEAGTKFITPNLQEAINESVETIAKQPLFKKLKGKDQVILTSQIEGVPVKCMIDRLDLKTKTITDWKTTANIVTFSPAMYVGQLAFYKMIVEKKYKIKNPKCILAVADKNPYIKRVGFFQFLPEELEEAEQNLKDTLTQIKSAKETGLYSPTDDIRDCWTCDYYRQCPHSKQKDFLTNISREYE